MAAERVKIDVVKMASEGVPMVYDGEEFTVPASLLEDVSMILCHLKYSNT